MHHNVNDAAELSDGYKSSDRSGDRVATMGNYKDTMFDLTLGQGGVEG